MGKETHMETKQKPEQPDAKRPFLSERSGIKTRNESSEKSSSSTEQVISFEEQAIKLLKSIDSKLTFIVLVIGLAIVLTMCNPF